jgi:hypothetical protein
MNQCAGIRADGGRCGARPMKDSAYCLNHNPERSPEEHRRASSKGGRRAGRGRPSAELKRLQLIFEKWADEVREGELGRADAAVMCQLLNGARACIRDLLAAREQEELVERLEAIEEALEQKEERRYGT